MDEKSRRRLERATRAFYDSGEHLTPQNRKSAKTRFFPGMASFLVCSGVIVVVLVMCLWRLCFPGMSPLLAGSASEQEGQDSQSAGAQLTAGQSDDQASSQKRLGELRLREGSSPSSQSGETGDAFGDGLNRGRFGDGSARLVVYVTGHVRKPGVVTLDSGRRLIDAVHASGGFLPEADQQAINMARLLVDGEHITIWKIGEAPPRPQDASGEYRGQGAKHTYGGSSWGDSARPQGGCVDINTAGAEELQRLNGVGPALAKRILSHRQKVGSITSVEQLKDIKGIGNALVEKITEEVCQ